MADNPHKTPLIAQDVLQLTDTILPKNVGDAVTATTGDWVKAVRERQMPSRDVEGFSAHRRHSGHSR